MGPRGTARNLEPLSTYLEPWMAQAVRRLAREQERPAAALARRIVREWLVTQGITQETEAQREVA